MCICQGFNTALVEVNGSSICRPKHDGTWSYNEEHPKTVGKALFAGHGGGLD